MAANQEQQLVDLEEAALVAQYRRRHFIIAAVDDAARRAEAMSRLEAWLRARPNPLPYRA